MGDPGRAHGDLPSNQPSPIDREWKEYVRVTEGVVVEIIPGALVIFVHLKGPAAERNCETELVCLIALATERNFAKALGHGKIKQRTAADR